MFVYNYKIRFLKKVYFNKKLFKVVFDFNHILFFSIKLKQMQE